MGWDFYMRGYGPKTISEFRDEITALITAEVVEISTTPTAIYYAIRDTANSHQATIWDVDEGEEYTTIITVPYKRPSGRDGFGKGNAYDETGGPSNYEPARKVFKHLTPLRSLNAAEIAYKDAYTTTHRMPYPTPDGVNDRLVWAHMWREKVMCVYKTEETLKRIKPGVKFQTNRKFDFSNFSADTFIATEGVGSRKLSFIPVNAPNSRCRLNKAHLQGATILD